MMNNRKYLQSTGLLLKNLAAEDTSSNNFNNNNNNSSNSMNAGFQQQFQQFNNMNNPLMNQATNQFDLFQMKMMPNNQMMMSGNCSL